MPLRHLQLFGPRALPRAVTAALLLLAAYGALDHWRNLHGSPGAAVTTPPAFAEPEVNPAVAPDYARIADLHLFGQASSSEEAAAEPVPETRLRLTLYGVMLEPGASGAIVGEPGGEQRYVRVGGTLPGGGVLRQVQPDRIVFERQGRREALRFADGGEDRAALIMPADASDIAHGDPG